MTTRYIDLPGITISTLPFGSDLARHGEIKSQGTTYINFLLLPDGHFLVIYAAAVVPSGTVLAFGRLIFEHQGSCAVVSHGRPDEILQVKAWPPTRNQGRDGLQSASCWQFGARETSARLDLLDDPEWAEAKVQFGKEATDLLLHHVASIVLMHWADLQDAAAGRAGKPG